MILAVTIDLGLVFVERQLTPWGEAEGHTVIDFLGDVARWFTENWDGESGYIHRTWEHIWVSGWSVGLAAAIAVPLGAWFGHTRRFGIAAISVVNIGRALPSFGIVALALPITIRLAGKVPVHEQRARVRSYLHRPVCPGAASDFHEHLHGGGVSRPRGR